MERAVQITIKGLQIGANSEEDQTETLYEGKYFDRDGKEYIIYDEYYDDVATPTKTMVKLAFNEVTITKKGAISVQLPFKTGKKLQTNYDTPYGSFVLGVQTKNISVQKNAEKIEIDISYKLDMNYEFLADCNISIIAKYV